MKTRFLVGTSLLALAIPAFADNLSTGIATWNVTEENSYNLGATATAGIVTPSDADWYGGWVPNSLSSSWVAYDPGNCCDNGLGDYTTTFTLNAGDLATANITGAWTLDDSGVLLLNGNQIATLGDGNWGALSPFAIAAGSPFFQLGTNTLEADITDSDSFLEGVNIQANLGTAAVPEPTGVMLLFTVVAALGIFGRRKFLAIGN
jgi:hypothetical protein